MFPQIAKRKKKEIIADDRVYKEWDEVSKELDQRVKLAFKKVPNALLHDFSKVCRIKSVPDFYANYFLLFSHRHTEPALTSLFQQEIESLLTHHSHFHNINSAIQERQNILNSIKDSLVIVEGFMLMSQGKNIPLAAKGTIEDLVKDCHNLDQLRELERQKVEELAVRIIKMRDNAVTLLKSVTSWRQHLQQLGKGELSHIRRMRIIYPSQGMNCLTLLFYDSQFLRHSTLKSQISFGKEGEDPFFQKIGKQNKGGMVQSYLAEKLKTNPTDYRDYVQRLKAEFPRDEAEQQRQKELEQEQQKQRIMLEKAKEQKEKEEKIKAMREEKISKVQRHSSMVKKGDGTQRFISKTSRGTRSQKKIINIDALLTKRNEKDNQKQLPSKDSLKIVGVYQKGKRPSKSSHVDASLLSQKEIEIQHQKRLWQKQIKEQQNQKQKIKKQLKQTEKKALVQTRQFQQKLKKYEEQVSKLKSRIDSAKMVKNPNGTSERQRKSPSKAKKSVQSVSNVYSPIKEGNRGSSVAMLQSKLEEESRMKRSLQHQIKQLGKEKVKLERTLEKESAKISKETDHFQRKLDKYQETINRLKGQKEGNKRVISELQNSRVKQQKKLSENLRMYTVKEKQEELKRNIMQKIQMRDHRKRQRQSRIQEQLKRKRELDLSRSRSRSIPQLSDNRNLQIVKTKQTIEIVFEPKSRRKSKEPVNNQLKEAEHKLVRLERERELLEKKLEFSAAGPKKLFESRIQQQENKAERVRQQLQKQKDRNHKLEQNIRKMKKSINSEFDIRLNRQRVKFEREKQELLKTIEKEKQDKYNKDKVLQEQLRFLKKMQQNQDELITMLNRQKSEKREKERMLAEELEKKEELMGQLQIEEIKKAIERQVRKQLLQSDQQSEEDIQFQSRKAEIQMQIQNLKQERDHEFSQFDQQNDKLRELITRIKGEENHLLEAIRENIELESQDEQQHREQQQSRGFNKTGPQTFLQNRQATIQNRGEVGVQNEVGNNNSTEELMEQLKHKTVLQFKSEQKKRQVYSDIEGSPSYKDKQKIQNLVQFYLKSPHNYPGQKVPTIDNEEKKHIVKQLQSKNKLIQDFQNDLFSSKDLPDFVPQMKNSPINNHFLNLRGAYQDYEADALRRQLFPPLREEEVYNQRELSVQSEEPPVVSIMDDVRVHAQKYSPKKKEDKKNFLAINRVRLMLLQDNRKQKQREMIEDQSKKKVQKGIFDQNRQKRQQRNHKRGKRDEDNRREKLKQLEKSLQEREERKTKNLSNRQHSRQSNQVKSKRNIADNKSDASSISRKSSRSKTKIVTRSKHSRSERGLSESQTEREKHFSDVQPPRELQIEPATIQAIKEEQIQHSIDLKEQEDLQKVERALLKQEVKSIQSDVRSYISGEEQFQVYQQFVSEDELSVYIDQLLQLASDELKNLNGNDSLKEDMQDHSSVAVLVAKNRKNIEIGVGIFHKDYRSGQYHCDFVLAHRMPDFLNLLFNLSRYIYQKDSTAQHIEFIFDLKYVEDPQTLHHFLEFQKKCRRMGEVYVKARNAKERKYILKRVLFQEIEEVKAMVVSGGIDVGVRLLMFDAVMGEVGEGFNNSSNPNYSSVNLILAYYLSKHPERLIDFRRRAQSELNYREMLVTALLFQKKELDIKIMNGRVLDKRSLLAQLSKIKERLDIMDIEEVEEMKFDLKEQLPLTVKRCTLEVDLQPTDYLILKPQEAVTRVQSSNSSQSAMFLSIIPKSKVMVIEAQEFITMHKANSDLTAFFYVKHFIKNIVEVKKQIYQRVYIPEIKEQDDLFFKDISKRMEGTVLLEESLHLGWKDTLGNSVMFPPRHKDLVIQRPFLLAVLSGPVERAVEGSPVSVRLIK